MTRIHFKSRKDPLFGVVILGAALTMLIILIVTLVQKGIEGPESVWGFVISGVTIGFLLWLWFDTRYYIDQGFVYYRSGPICGKIRVSSIKEVIVNTTMWAGFRPALARKGVIVKYNRYDDIYFSPDDNEAFIEVLCRINPGIHIVNNADQQ